MRPDVDGYRAEVRAFIAEHARAMTAEGVRAPKNAAEEAAIRAWLRSLYEAGHLGAGWPEQWGGRPDHPAVHDLILMEELILGDAGKVFDLAQEKPADRERYGRNTFGQSCLLARRLLEAGTRVVEVIWPKVANSDNHSWDHHVGLTQRMKNQSGPMLDQGLSALFSDLDATGLLDETIVVVLGEFGRSPEKGVSTSGNGNSADGRDHWPYCYTAVVGGAGIKRGYIHGKSDATGSAPVEDAVHPTELLATIYHAVGIDPETIVYNHLNQPRELVKAKPVTKLFA